VAVSAQPGSVDWGLALKAGLNGLVFVAPAAVVAQLLAEDSGEVTGVAGVAVIAVQVLGFCFAGWVVRRLVPGSPIATCAAAGVACWAILQAVGIVTSVLRGQDLSPLRWVATGLLAALAAAAGGLLTRVEPRTPSSRSPEDTP
jgi:hypothetical protein